jgi:SAM-dependent methyltransferase
VTPQRHKRQLDAAGTQKMNSPPSTAPMTKRRMTPARPLRRRPAIEFAIRTLARDVVVGRDVLEVGSWAGDGTARAAVEARDPATYMGIDIKPGPGVDRVCRVEDLVEHFGDSRFDIVFATEVVEHIRDWRVAFQNMAGVLRLGGLILLTTRSPGYPYHGSPHDYWRYDAASMRRIFRGWRIEALEPDPDRPGIFLVARKQTGELADLSAIPLYSVALSGESIELSTSRIVLHRLSSPRRAAAWLVPDRAKPPLRWIAGHFGYSTSYRGPSSGGNLSS